MDTGAAPGLYHCVNAGMGTWYEVAVEAARLLGVTPRLVPVTMAQVQMKASRPRFCALSNRKLDAAGFRMPTWSDALRRWLDARAVARQTRTGTRSASARTRSVRTVTAVRLARHWPPSGIFADRIDVEGRDQPVVASFRGTWPLVGGVRPLPHQQRCWRPLSVMESYGGHSVGVRLKECLWANRMPADGATVVVAAGAALGAAAIRGRPPLRASQTEHASADGGPLWSHKCTPPRV